MIERISDCPFCNPGSEREIILENEFAYSVYDNYPVSRGHSLVIIKRHCASYFALTAAEQASCWNLVNDLERILSVKFQPDGFNIGINVNDAAGQTIFHMHIHLIPRFKGDVQDPEGGVRGIIPGRRRYKYRMDIKPWIEHNEHHILGFKKANATISFIHSQNQIFELISRADDYYDTKRLIAFFDGIKKIRFPFYLTMDELDEILHWKLRRQYNRQSRNINRNTDSIVREITQSAFSIEDFDNTNEVALCLKTLIKLHGVQIPVASAIMTLCYPDRYCVIDFRGWRQIFGSVKKYPYYTVKDYIMYWTIIKQKADVFGVKPQEVDMAIWQFDIESHRKR